MGGNREFSQRLHLRPDAQATVLGDLQIFREIHHRFRGHGMALLVVKVEDGSDRMGGHVHEHQIGGDGRAVGEMRKVQGKHFRRFRRGFGPVGSPAPAVAVHRPHLEDVDRAVNKTGDRMGGVGGADGSPEIPPVDPVLVIRDRRSAVTLRGIPGERHLLVSTVRQQIRGRVRHRLAWATAAATATGGISAAATGHGGAGAGGVSGGAGDVREGAEVVGVGGRDAVVTGGAGGQLDLGVGRVGIASAGPPVGSAIGRDMDPVGGDGAAAVVGGGGPGEVDLGGPASCCREVSGGTGHGGAGGDFSGVRGLAGAVGVDGGDAVVAGGAGGQAGVGVGCAGAGGVGDEGGPVEDAIGGDLDPVAGDGATAVADRGGPVQIDDRLAVRGGDQPRRGAGNGDGGVVGDGGDAVLTHAV